MSEGSRINALLSRVVELDRHVEEGEHRTAIYRLLVDLQTAMDERDLVRYGSYYTEDGEWCAVSGRAVGPAAITDFLGKYCKPWASQEERTFHSIADVAIDLHGDYAIAMGQWRHDHPGDAGQPVTVHFGRFEVIAKRTSDGWRIRRRESYGLLPYIEPSFQLIGRAEAHAEVAEAARRVSSSMIKPDHGDDAKEIIISIQSRLNDLESRVQAAEDRNAIDRLFVDLQTAMDERDLDRYGAFYTSDGEWCAVNGRAIGPTVIAKHLSQYCKPWESPDKRTYHSLSDVVIDLDGNRASARGQWQHIHPGENGHPVTQNFGRFEAVLRRTSEGWRLERRASYLTIPYVEPKYQLIGPAEAEASGAPVIAGTPPQDPVSAPETPTETSVTARCDALEKRIQALDDREQIYRQFLNLQEATDGRDGVAYGQCFTEDGEWSGVTSRAVGRDEIAEFMSKFMTPWANESVRTYHSISDLTIDLNGDVAMARAQYHHRKMGEDGRPVAFHVCHYEGIMRRDAGGWLFRRRDSYMDLPFVEPKFQLIGLAEARADWQRQTPAT